ncbi:acyltransferase family protein [Spirosoma flavum]|uniref:Acyltransferase family protein n=1 Tax=Spirosoma flavum TaxID=2048557 RepID=A0ABW6AGR0_9BACT
MKPTSHPALERRNEPLCYVPPLTGLRAIAAYLVFLHHYNPATPGSFANRLFAQGYIGVSMLFVLSGFLIYHRYADGYFKHKSWSWRNYLHNRFARIFPLYALLLLVTVGVNAMLGHTMSWPLLALNLTVTKGFFDTYKFSGIAQSWSLTVEVCFYLSAPFLFAALQRWGIFLLTASLVIIGAVLRATVGEAAWKGLFGSLPFVAFYTFFGRSFEFIVGMWVARRWHQNKLPDNQYTTGVGFLIIVSCVLWQASFLMLTADPITLFWSEVVVYNYILPIGIGLFLLGLISQKSLVQHLLSQPIMQMAGRSSYAFYLIHIGVVASGLQKLGVTNNWLLFGLLVLTAHGLYSFVEKPMQQRIKARQFS